VLRESESANKHEARPFDRRDIVWILDRVLAVFKAQSMLVETDAPVSICGDIHAQFADLLRLFNQNGWPPKVRYMFLGDYVDRGPANIETILLMFCLKVRSPNDFFLLRGNHETRSINRVYGFYDEVKDRYDQDLYEVCNTVFDYMPLSGLVSKRILCMHGGISPDLASFDDIAKIRRPMVEVPDTGLIADLLWADPRKDAHGYEPSTRGISFEFGADVVIELCDVLGLDLVARAHQVVNDGYEFFADDRLITLFSAPDYCNQFTNSGGILCIEKSLACRIKQIPSKSKKQ